VESLTVMVVGQIARDLVLRVDELPEAGEAADASWRREILGGKGANAAADASRAASAVLLQLQQPPAPLIAAAQHAKAGGALVVSDGALVDDTQRGALLAVTDVIRADAHETELLIGRRADVAAASVTVGHAGGRPNLDRTVLRRATEQIDEALRRRHA
jgi:sugar/nucleoside kinase (ribokinase family)